MAVSGAQTAQRPDHVHTCNCPPCKTVKDAESKSDARQVYIRQHAPTILAAILYPKDIIVCGPDVELRWARNEAVKQAGLLFDETEREAKP